MLRKSFVMIFLLMLVTLGGHNVASAQQQPTTKQPKLKNLHATEPAAKPVSRPHTTSSCAEFGAGFARLPGSDTCVRIGGSIEAGVGGRF